MTIEKLPDKYTKALKLFAALGISREELIKDAIEERITDILIEAQYAYKMNGEIDPELVDAIKEAFSKD